MQTSEAFHFAAQCLLQYAEIDTEEKRNKVLSTLFILLKEEESMKLLESIRTEEQTNETI